jgi:NAD dependent epimerase/dehydratase family enzyme
VKAIRRIAEATAARDVRLVIASLAVAPAGAGPEFRETDPYDGQQTAAGRLVDAWESEAEALRKASWNVALVRLGLVAADTRILGELVRLARRGIVPNLKGTLIPTIAAEDAAAMLVGILQQRAMVGLVYGVAPTPVKGEAVMTALRALSPLPRPLIWPLRLLRRRLGLALALLACRRHIVPNVLIEAGASFTAVDPTERIAETIASHSVRRTTRRPPPEPPIAPARLMPEATPATTGEPLALRRQP